MTDTVRVVARLVVKAEHADAFKAAAKTLVTETRKETGCTSYQLLQNLQDPTDFTFVEEWASAAALDAHMKAPHLAAAFQQVGPMLAAAADIRRYAVVI